MLRIVRFAAAVVGARRGRAARTFQKSNPAERLATCEPCDFREVGSSAGISPCGCFIWLKARWRSEDCPAGKWPIAPPPSPSAPD